MTPACELPNGVLRQWHVYDREGVCACGAKETRPAPVSLPAPRAKSVDTSPPAVAARRLRRAEVVVTVTPVAPPVERRAPEPLGDPGLTCPVCKVITITNVTDSRPQPGRIMRRRHCGKCNMRFTTYERIGSFDDDRRKRTDD